MSAEKICAHFFWGRFFLFSSLDLKPCEWPSEAAPILPADWRRPPPRMARRRGVPQARKWAQAPGPPLEGNAKSSPSCQTGLARTVSRSGPQASESSRPPTALPASECARRLQAPLQLPKFVIHIKAQRLEGARGGVFGVVMTAAQNAAHEIGQLPRTFERRIPPVGDNCRRNGA